MTTRRHGRVCSARRCRPGATGDEFNDDWKNYVEPELQELFQSAREIVARDLAQLPPATAHPPVGSFESAAFAPSRDALEIPLRHAEAWLSVLNQARLGIAARHGFGEREIEAGWPLPPFTERDLDLFRLHFFEEMQQILLSSAGLRLINLERIRPRGGIRAASGLRISHGLCAGSSSGIVGPMARAPGCG